MVRGVDRFSFFDWSQSEDHGIFTPIAALYAPAVLLGGGPAVVEAAKALGWKAAVWAANNPLKAYIARAVGEELYEALITGTSPDPMMVAMDLVSAGVLDDLGVVYRRTDFLTGEEYVGQAKNWQRYLTRQREHARDHPDAVFGFEVLD